MSGNRTNFLLAQMTFWLLAATDGHGKNFSLHHQIGGACEMTPQYDVLSAWPVIGHGKKQLPIEKAKLAMAVRGSNAHYRIHEIQAPHWKALAESSGIPAMWKRVQDHVESVVPAIERVGAALPDAFPERVYSTIGDGARSQVRRFAVAIRTA